MRHARSAVFLLVLGLATPAGAGPKRVVSPALFPPADGNLFCVVLNGSDKKPLEFRLLFLDATAAVLLGDDPPSTIGPGQMATNATPDDDARYCVVEVVKGDVKSVRLTVTSRDASDQPLQTVTVP